MDDNSTFDLADGHSEPSSWYKANSAGKRNCRIRISDRYAIWRPKESEGRELNSIHGAARTGSFVRLYPPEYLSSRHALRETWK
jgi:hypothetical protein